MGFRQRGLKLFYTVLLILCGTPVYAQNFDPLWKLLREFNVVKLYGEKSGFPQVIDFALLFFLFGALTYVALEERMPNRIGSLSVVLGLILSGGITYFLWTEVEKGLFTILGDLGMFVLLLLVGFGMYRFIRNRSEGTIFEQARYGALAFFVIALTFEIFLGKAVLDKILDPNQIGRNILHLMMGIAFLVSFAGSFFFDFFSSHGVHHGRERWNRWRSETHALSGGYQNPHEEQKASKKEREELKQNLSDKEKELKAAKKEIDDSKKVSDRLYKVAEEEEKTIEKQIIDLKGIQGNIQSIWQTKGSNFQENMKEAGKLAEDLKKESEKWQKEHKAMDDLIIVMKEATQKLMEILENHQKNAGVIFKATGKREAERAYEMVEDLRKLVRENDVKLLTEVEEAHGEVLELEKVANGHIKRAVSNIQELNNKVASGASADEVKALVDSVIKDLNDAIKAKVTQKEWVKQIELKDEEFKKLKDLEKKYETEIEAIEDMLK